MIEVETGVIQLQAKDCRDGQAPPEAGKGKEGFYLGS